MIVIFLIDLDIFFVILEDNHWLASVFVRILISKLNLFIFFRVSFGFKTDWALVKFKFIYRKWSDLNVNEFPGTDQVHPYVIIINMKLQRLSRNQSVF